MTCNTVVSLFWGYTAFFALLAVYLLRVGMRLARIEKQYAALRTKDHKVVESAVEDSSTINGAP